MSDILTHLRNAARACTDTYEVAMTTKEARQLVALIDGQAADIKRLADALEALVTNHARLVGSGDCGNWNVDEEPEMIAARTALDALDAVIIQTNPKQ